MKKHVFSLMMVLALVVLAGTSTFAQQGTGVAPDDPYFALEGAVTTHTITLAGGTGNTTTWSFLEVSNVLANVGEAGAAATPGTDYVIVSGGGAGDASVAVRWLQPSGNDLYAVQVEETAEDANGNCTTIRRSYISIFSFDINVYLATANDGTGATQSPILGCNNWSGTLVDTLDGGEITGMHADYINNPTDDTEKIDSTFWRIGVGVSGGLQLNAMKFELFYTLTNRANLNLYDLESFDGATFRDEPTIGAATAQVSAADATSEVDETAASNNIIYLPAVGAVDTINYDFQFVHHNILGSAPSVFEIQIDSVHVEFNTTAGAGSFDNGTKYHSTEAPANYPTLADGATVTRTITHGPATGNIVITD